MKKIYVLDAFDPAGVEWLSSRADVIPFKDPRGARWHEDADGIMVRSSKVTAQDFAAARKLKALVKQGVGIDNIDLDAARKQGVVVANTPGINREAVSELALGLALSVSRRVTQFDRMIRAGEQIERPQYLGVSLQDKTLGLIGMGNIGTRSAQRFHGAFNCRILAYDPYREKPAGKDPWDDIPHERVDSLADLWPRTDVLTLHVPLTDETYHMVGRDQLAAMKQGSVLVNTARGGVVDEAALYDALVSGHLFGAGLDVFEDVEPPPTSHPLLSLPNVIATPHAAAGSFEVQAQSSMAVAKELFNVLNGGEPASRVA
jgi:D-3-phosphoglycerate dehydrogenase